MNIQAMMKQAKQLQQNMLNEKEKIDNELFPGKYSFVEIEMNGKKEITKLSIDKEAIESDDDWEMLQDAIIVAVNSTIKKIDEETEKRMSKYSAGLPGMF